MSKNKNHGGNPGRNDHDDHGAGNKGVKLKGTNGDNALTGTERDDDLSGGKGNDLLVGLGGNDKLKGGKGDDRLLGGDGNDRLDGGKGNDFLDGGASNDLLIGGKGNDQLFGGAGDDVLYGDKGGKGHSWGWDDCFWWKPKSEYDDFLDGGAGNDRVFAGRGDDVALYSMSGNLGAGFADICTRDSYDGGTGFDTLQLALTYGELQLASVQQDIAAFQAFLERNANPHSDNGKTFEFKSFDLYAKNFEALLIQKLNTGPTAHADSGSTNEDTLLVVAAPGVLANDTDPDHLDVLSVLAGNATSAMGAVVVLSANGGYSYNPTGARALQQLSQGATATDSFSYTIADLAGATSTATVQIVVTGVNDAPVAAPDAFQVSEDAALAVAAPGVLGNDSDVDSAALSAILVSGPAHGVLTLNADGSLSYLPGADYYGDDSFTYLASDGLAGSEVQTAGIKVTEVNDAPVAADDAVTVAEDSPDNVIAVLVNDNTGPANESGQSLSVSAASALHGSVLINADGTLSYTPGADYFGADTISYTVTDNGTTNGLPDPRSDEGQVAVTVTEVNDAPVAADDAATVAEDSPDNVIAVLVNDNTGPANESGQSLSVSAASALHGSVLINADGTLSYTPGADYFGADTISYTVTDNGTTNGLPDPRSDEGLVAVTVTPVNDDPVARDDEITGSGGGGGPIRVAVVGGGASTYVAAAGQLNDETNDAFDLDATPIVATAFATESDWAAALAGYDVVVLGGSGGGNDYGDSSLFAALGDFVNAGGGVVTTGWFAQAMASMSGVTLNDADYITPITGDTYAWANNLSTITILDPAHPITAGIPGSSYTVAALLHELAPAIDGSVTQLATGTATSGDTLTAIAYDEVSAGLTVYLGSLHFANAGYSPELIRTGAADQIFEQAVNWAAGPQDTSTAATDEDSALTIDDALLLANDTDVDPGDILFIDSVQATSLLGASVSLDAGGNVVYDPTAALQYLSAGETAFDSFEYTVSDGNGGLDTATVTLTVEGNNDAPVALDDSNLILATHGFEGANAGNVDGSLFAGFDIFPIYGVGGSSMAYAYTGNDFFEDGADGALQRLDGEDFGLLSLDVAAFFVPHAVTIAGYDDGVQVASLTIELGVAGPSNGATGYTSLSFDASWGGIDQVRFYADEVFDYTFIDNVHLLLGTAGSEDTPIDIDVLANDTDPDASDALEVSAFSMSALGAAISLNANGTLHYDPTDLAEVQALTTGQTATDTFTYTVSDGHGGADSATVSIQIVGVDDAPVAADDAASTDEDTAVSINVLQNDFDLDAGQVPAVSEFSAQSAMGAAISLNADGTLKYDPTMAAVIQALAEGEAATDTFSYAVSDGHGGVGEGTVVVELTGVNDAPVAAGETYQLGEGGVLTVPGSDGVLANDEDVDSAVLGAVLVEGPAHGTLTLNADGSFSYTSEASFDGSDSFTYRASDGALESNTATVSLTGSAVNHAPVANNNSYSMNEDTTLTVATAAGVLTNDTDADGDALSAVLVSGPAHGALALGADGAFSYTPNANFFGSDSFSYKANDGIADSKAATVGITIANVAESNGSGKVAAEVSPGTTLQYFMRVEGVTKDWVELDAFSLGMSNPGSVGTGGGAGAGRTTAQDVFVALGSTQAAAKLVEYVSTGKHLTKVEIEAYTPPGGDKGGALVDEFLFTDVLVSSLQTSSGGNNLSFDYAKFGHTHVEQSLEGGTGTKNDTGFDFSLNKIASGPSGGADALKAKQDDVGSPQELDYYAHFEGVGGASTWLKLGSFSLGLSNSGSIGSGGGGAGAGKTTAQDVFVTLGSSNALVDLNEALNTGKHLTKVEIEAYAPGGDKGNALIDEYIFNDVLVTSLQTSNASHNSLSFDFAKFSYGHQLYKEDGTAGSFVAEGYDFTTAKAFDGPDPADNLSGGKVAAEVSPGTTLQYFMRVEGVTKDWVELDAFSLGMSNPGSVGTGGGAGAGRTTAQDVFVALGSTQAAAKLVEYVSTGKHLTKVEIEAYTPPGGDKGGALVDEFLFTDVLVSSLQTSSGGNNLSFDYAKFGHTHVEQSLEGGTGTKNDTGFDFSLNKIASGPSGGADALKAKQDDVGSPQELDYYAHFEGVGGASTWLKLGSFSLGLSNSGSIGSGGGGAGAGKTTAQDVFVTLGSSNALVDLNEALNTGKHLTKVEIEAYAPGGDKGNALIDEYIFNDVLVTSLQTSNASHNSLSFDFAKFSYGHQLYKEDGTAGSFVAEGYDFTTAKAFDGPDPADNLSGGKVAAEVSPGTTLQYFMRVEGVTKDWVELDAFSLGMSNPGSVGTGGGAGAGRTTAQDVFVALGSTQAAAKLVEYVSTGKHLTKVEIEAYTPPGGDKGGALVDEFLFTDVLVSSLQTSSGGNNLSFDYAKFGHTHVEQSLEGGTGTKNDTGFDFSLNKIASGPSGGADALKAKQDDVGSPQELDYYAHFEGVGGASTWLKLGSFSLGLSNSGSIGSGGGGAGAGKTTAQDVFVTLGSSNALVDLNEALNTGKHLTKVEIEAYAPGGDKGNALIDEYIFNDVLVTSLQTSNASHNSLSFDFAKFSYGHQLYKEDGTAGSFVAEGYDFTTAKAFDGPAPDADIGFF